jgi:hypothetical protein
MSHFFEILILFFLSYLFIKYLRNLLSAAFGKNQSQPRYQKKEEGKVTIDFIPQAKKTTKVNKTEAEVVDFEEIK